MHKFSKHATALLVGTMMSASILAAGNTFVTVNGTKVCCRLAPDAAPALGATLQLRLDPARVLLFDAQSGERLRKAPAAGETKVTPLARHKH